MRLYRTMLESWIKADSPRLASGALEGGADCWLRPIPMMRSNSMLMQQAVWLHGTDGALSHLRRFRPSMPDENDARGRGRVAGAWPKASNGAGGYRDPKRRRFTGGEARRISRNRSVVGPRRKRGRPRKNEQIEGLCDGGREIFPERRRRKYRLSPRGLEALRQSHLAEEAVDSESGPSSVLGKKRSRPESVVLHGLFTKALAEEGRKLRRCGR